MRMRRKKWARPELNSCPFFIQNAPEYRCKWNKAFLKNQPVCLELGCGKGEFISKKAVRNPNVNYIAVDISMDVLASARRNIVKEFANKNLKIDNVLLAFHDIMRIPLMLGKTDIIDEIYIQFCNPWPKQKHKKRRLTYPTQLENYKEFLKDNGEIHFKTDDEDLFFDSIKYFEKTGFEILYKTENFKYANAENTILSEHEKMYLNEGCKIKFLKAKKI